ncbi:MAG: PKD domain-containing protein [Candidatus Cloacimonetes bacterium]|nr:PKD domain-containing protein [Candidatus Cloacimonadota bacterium]
MKWSSSILIFLIITSLSIPAVLAAESRTVSAGGYCYQENATTFEGTGILFEPVSPSAVRDSTYTDITGYFSIILSEGIYNVVYSHSGYQDIRIDGVNIFTPLILETVTLQASGILVSGEQSGVWETGNVYNVMGNITVPASETLIIEPGVTVEFMGYYYLRVFGSLIAIGTENDNILFTSGEPEPAPGDWNSISFNFTDAFCVISYASIEYAYRGVSCMNSSPLISYNQFNDISHDGVYSSGGAAEISYNLFMNNNAGLYCFDSEPLFHDNYLSSISYGVRCENFSNPEIYRNLISNFTSTGILCSTTSEPVISDNTIINDSQCSGITINDFCSPDIFNNTLGGNYIGIVCSANSNSVIQNNIFYNNTHALNSTGTGLTLQYNLFWENTALINGNGIPEAFGEIVTININGDDCDTYMNLFLDPLFSTGGNFNYYLSSESPAIDAGNPEDFFYDPDGTIADIGAHYYDQGSEPPFIEYISSQPDEGEAPLVVMFSPEISGAVTSYLWEFGDGSNSAMKYPVHIYTEAGLYSVALTVSGPGGEDEMLMPDFINVLEAIQPLAAQFSAAPLSGTLPLTVNFYNLSQGQPDDYFWDFGDTGSSYEENPQHIYQAPGIYTVSLTVYGAEGSDTETKTDYIQVIEPEEVAAAFSVSDSIGTVPFTVEFFNESLGSISSVNWDFGNGDNSEEFDPVYTFQGSGEYEVILTVFGYAGSSSASRFIYAGNAVPQIIQIIDRPNDQGGYVYLTFSKSFYDTVEPRMGNDRETESYSVQYLFDETWISIASVLATGEENYTALAETYANNEQIWFRVIAGMEEATWISDSQSGISLDNLFPSIPSGLIFTGDILQWSAPVDDDFNFFNIYLEGDIIAQVITNSFEPGILEGHFQVSATDFNGNESDLSEGIIAQINYGDVDDNGEIDCFDASLLLMISVGYDPLPCDPLPWENWRFYRSDTDLDGEITSYDAALILQYIVQIINELPYVEQVRSNK